VARACGIHILLFLKKRLTLKINFRVSHVPLYAGIIFVPLGLLNLFLYGSSPTLDILNWYFPILIMGVPWLLTGLLLLFAAWKTSKATT
jgi:hypothetical protein